jgi:hypothetical protein
MPGTVNDPVVLDPMTDIIEVGWPTDDWFFSCDAHGGGNEPLQFEGCTPSIGPHLPGRLTWYISKFFLEHIGRDPDKTFTITKVGDPGRRLFGKFTGDIDVRVETETAKRAWGGPQTPPGESNPVSKIDSGGTNVTFFLFAKKLSNTECRHWAPFPVIKRKSYQDDGPQLNMQMVINNDNVVFTATSGSEAGRRFLPTGQMVGTFPGLVIVRIEPLPPEPEE